MIQKISIFLLMTMISGAGIFTSLMALDKLDYHKYNNFFVSNFKTSYDERVINAIRALNLAYEDKSLRITEQDIKDSLTYLKNNTNLKYIPTSSLRRVRSLEEIESFLIY